MFFSSFNSAVICKLQKSWDFFFSMGLSVVSILQLFASFRNHVTFFSLGLSVVSILQLFADFRNHGAFFSAWDGISSPIAAHILDFCDDGNGGDLFAAVNATASPEDASASSSSTATTHADSLSPLPSLDSTLSALLEQDEPTGTEGELLLPLEDYTFAAAVDDTQTPEEQQQFGQMTLPMVPAPAAEHPALQTQLSSTASELMQFASGYNDECFAAALAGAGVGAGGFMGMDEPLCPQQQAMLPAGAGEAFFSNNAHAHPAQAGFFTGGGGGGGCTGNMMMSMMGMDEIGEYQRMMECGGALLGAHATDGAEMAFGNAAAEMQMGGNGSPVRLPATGTEVTSLEDTSFKTVRLSNEERKEKIHRYIKKRNERNFSKKIKVSTLAEKPSQTAGLASAAGSPRTTTTARHPGRSARRITKSMNRLAA
ncbi:uncharacterized protein LOC102716903 isoform X2 [Oryza brachyantha]|uniref:uncharacterized protein LOC102716903 isoform X2 n=1 Tax=Oryza brachyantha TaxID=4533 RepID=UPI0007760630|nr:uncharacterized protein LOC102716903 isoform X2 [Oryza brachyantha]